VAFVSLGCAKNLVDSEVMLARLAESGALITGEESAADTVVVNTCGFLRAARDEAIVVLRDLVRRKRRGDLKRTVVAGCLVQRDGEQIRRLVPEVDALVGVNNREEVARAVWSTDQLIARNSLYVGPRAGGGKRTVAALKRLSNIERRTSARCAYAAIPGPGAPLHRPRNVWPLPRAA